MKKTGLTYILVFSTALSYILIGCENRASEENQPEMAVSNSYLKCAVKDLCGDDTEILCLAPPGMCPGHFDISPAAVNKLCKCRILVRFDFEKGIDNSLLRMQDKGLKIGSVPAPAGLCVPETYLGVCRDVCNILSLEYPARKARYDKRLKLTEERLDNLSNELVMKIKQSGLWRAKVLTSEHQSEFCNWLGLEVVATFAGSDTETAANINRCLEQGKSNTVRFIIANKQEGTGLAEALAERLGAKMIVFSNFPDADIGEESFDRLVLKNVEAFLECVAQSRGKVVWYPRGAK